MVAGYINEGMTFLIPTYLKETYTRILQLTVFCTMLPGFHIKSGSGKYARYTKSYSHKVCATEICIFFTFNSLPYKTTNPCM